MQTTKQIMDVIKTLFDEQGNCLNDVNSYYDEDGCNKYYFEMSQTYTKFPPNSNIVAMYYAAEYADQTHGNYTDELLFKRAMK